MPSNKLTTVLSVICLLTSTAVAIPQPQNPSSLKCPANSATFCGGASGQSTILITCSNGTPSSSDCLEHGETQRCFASSPTNAACGESRGKASAGSIPSAQAGAAPSNQIPAFPRLLSSGVPNAPSSRPLTGGSAQTNISGGGSSFPYVSAVSGAALATGAPFPPVKPGYGNGTLNSDWDPQPTQTSLEVEMVSSTVTISVATSASGTRTTTIGGSASASATFASGQSNGAVGKGAGWGGVLAVVAVMGLCTSL